MARQEVDPEERRRWMREARDDLRAGRRGAAERLAAPPRRKDPDDDNDAA